MTKESLTLDPKEILETGMKTHWISGIPVQCNRGPDCQFCLEEKRRLIKIWLKSIPYKWKNYTQFIKRGIPNWAIGKTIKQICNRCPIETIPCYLCLRGECKDWMVDPTFEKNSLQGCNKNFESYCMDWRCIHKPCLILRTNRWWLEAKNEK